MSSAVETNGKATKLNIGAGAGVGLEGYTPIDRSIGSEAYPLAYADESIEIVRASHILEHFPFKDVYDGPKLIEPCLERVLREWVRVLKPGGTLFLAVPDFEWIIRNGNDPKAPLFLMGGQSHKDDFHKSFFVKGDLIELMKHVGLDEIDTWKSDAPDCSSLPVSLNLKGTKKAAGLKISLPPTSREMDVKICAVMSIPRVGFNDNWGCILEALRPYKIPMRRFTGAYWEQCMTRVLEDCVKDGVDWVITIDYDSIFTAKHLDGLMHNLGRNPKIDAICALQVKRQADTALCSLTGQVSTGVCVDPIKVDTAHFGLTVIRLEALKEIPKPWFVGDPGPTLNWGEGRIDADIHFWNQWKDAGKTVYMDPTCRIGHMELVVSEFDERMNKRQLYVSEWRKGEGMDPAEVGK